MNTELPDQTIATGTSHADSPADAQRQLPNVAVLAPWYAIRLFSLRQREVADALKAKGLECFIPMRNVDYEDRSGRVRHEMRPVIHNLIFVRKSIDEQAFKGILAQLPYKMAVYKKSRESTEYYEIPARQMAEFQAMCNPELLMTKYLTEEEAKLKVGTKVLVSHGPLKGLTGRLVRQSHKYYLLKEVPGMAVMIKVSRWCCKAVAE